MSSPIERLTAPDSRLDKLDAESQALAIQFLNLHYAWDTEWEARRCYEMGFCIEWVRGDFSASFDHSLQYGWNAVTRQIVVRRKVAGHKENSTKWTNASPSLRLMREFMEFIHLHFRAKIS
jgi:hypothetical protein